MGLSRFHRLAIVLSVSLIAGLSCQPNSASPVTGPAPSAAVAQPVHSSAPPATFQVDAPNLSTAAQAALQDATGCWQRELSSPVVIEVAATWEPLPEQLLAIGRPAVMVRDFPGAPYAQTWYPSALANMLAGYDLNPSEPDIAIAFNSRIGNWSYDPADHTSQSIDFASVAAHELGHGFGFISNIASGQARGGSAEPFIFDRFVINQGSQHVIGVLPLATGAPAADSMLTGKLFWGGAFGTSANWGKPPRLTTAAAWPSGKSYVHLSEVIAGVPGATWPMTEGSLDSEQCRPGPVVLGILKDLGWVLTNAAPRPAPTPFSYP